MTYESMSPEARAEYDAALRAAVLRHGTLVDRRPDVYGWMDHNYAHAERCELTSTAAPEEVRWSEFQDTFSPNRERTGTSVSGVSCACGELVDREVRWEASVSEVTEALFAALFEQLVQLRAARAHESETPSD